MNFEDKISELREEILNAIEKEVELRGGYIKLADMEEYEEGEAEVPQIDIVDARFDNFTVGVLAVKGDRTIQAAKLNSTFNRELLEYECTEVLLDEYIPIEHLCNLYTFITQVEN